MIYTASSSRMTTIRFSAGLPRFGLTVLPGGADGGLFRSIFSRLVHWLPPISLASPRARHLRYSPEQNTTLLRKRYGQVFPHSYHCNRSLNNSPCELFALPIARILSDAHAENSKRRTMLEPSSRRSDLNIHRMRMPLGFKRPSRTATISISSA